MSDRNEERDLLEQSENNLNLLNLVNLTDNLSLLSAQNPSRPEIQSLGFPSISLTNTESATPTSGRGPAANPYADALADDRAIPRLGPSPAVIRAEETGPQEPRLGLGGPIPGRPSGPIRTEMDRISDRWVSPFGFVGSRPVPPASQERIQQAGADLPAVISGLFSGDRQANRVLEGMLQNGIPAAVIENAVRQRVQQEMQSATRQRPFQLSQEAARFLGQTASRDSREGNQAMETLMTIARGAENISAEASSAATAELSRMLIEPGARQRFNQATQSESNNFLNDLRDRVARNGQVAPFNGLQQLFLNNGIQQGHPAAVEIASRIATGNAGASEAAQQYYRDLLNSSISTAPSNQRQQAAERVINGLLQAGPNQACLATTREIGSRYPQALGNVVNGLRTQTASTDATARDSAYRQLAFIAAGGFGQNAESQRARAVLLESAQTAEGRQRVQAGLDANANRGLNQSELNGISRAVENIATRPSEEQQIRNNQNQLMQELFPGLNPQELNQLRDQAITRHGQDGFQRFLANLQMYRQASPELQRYLASNQALPENPAAGDNLLAAYRNQAPALDTTAALRQYAQGDLQGSNQHLNNTHERMNTLVSAIQRQLGSNETAIADAHNRYTSNMSALAGRLNDRADAPTLGPDQPRTSANEYMRLAQEAQSDINRLDRVQRLRQMQLNSVLGTQLLGTHTLLRQQNPAAADSLAIMANNYIPSNQLPTALRREVQNADGSPGPALVRADSRNAAISMLANSPAEALELIRRSAALTDNGRDSLTNEAGISGMDILQGIASGRLRVDAAQLETEARASQLHGAARRILSGSDGLMSLNARFNDLSSLQNFARIAGAVGNSEHAIRQFIAGEFEALENLVAPRPADFPVNPEPRLDGSLSRGPDPVAEHQARRTEIQNQLNLVNRSLAELTSEQRQSAAGRELQMRQRGLEALRNLMDPNSQLNADLRRLTQQFRDQNVSMSEEFLRQAAPIVAEIAIAAAASALVPGLGSVAALGRAGRIASFLMTNPIVRSAVRDEVMGFVNTAAGTGSAGPMTQFLGGRIGGTELAENMVRSQIQNATYGRLTGAVQSGLANQAGRRFRYGAQIVNPVLSPAATQASNLLDSGLSNGVRVLLR